MSRTQDLEWVCYNGKSKNVTWDCQYPSLWIEQTATGMVDRKSGRPRENYALFLNGKCVWNKPDLDSIQDFADLVVEYCRALFPCEDVNWSLIQCERATTVLTFPQFELGNLVRSFNSPVDHDA